MPAPKGNNFNPKGRPLADIDWNMFEQLCHIQCTLGEMAGFLRVNKDTLSDRAKLHYKEDYSVVYKRFSEGGKCSLRRSQFKLAQKNASMGIWLGKQYLDQKDHESETDKTAQMNPHLDIVHQVLAENAILKEKINAIESKANSELSGSDSQVQHMGGSSEVGQDPLQHPQAF